VFLSTLLLLAAIDWKTQLLPDQATQPLLWAGLLAALLGWNNLALADAVTGAVVGYLILWGIANLFKFVTGQDGMGQGDFKLLAAVGAWLGWGVLPGIVVLASVGAAVIGWRLSAAQRHIPFGPFLCACAALAWAQPTWLSVG
jgi:leader peptidase (prepilin peptidase)/N-methyltransferase